MLELRAYTRATKLILILLMTAFFPSLLMGATGSPKRVLPRGERQLWIRTSQEGTVVHAAVKDSGKGIPAGDFENIFKPFFTTKSQGLGMGLSINRSIIHRHQGRIWVENHLGQGATFHSSLPVARGEAIS